MLGLAGCAQMTVQVDILDRKYWSSAAELSNVLLERIATDARKRGNGEYADAREAMKANAEKAFDAFFVPLVKSNRASATDRPKFVAALHGTIDKAYEGSAAKFDSAFAIYSAVATQPPPKDQLPRLFQAMKELDEANGIIRSVRRQISEDLKAQIDTLLFTPAEKVAAQAPVQRAEASNRQVARGLLGDRDILNDPLASSVVYAGETYWVRPESPKGFNETYAQGMFGNTDVAVKMESVGNFTLKGVRLDASKITQASFSVVRQAIKATAALSGIPLPSGAASSSTTPAAAFAETPISLTSPDQRRAAAEDSLMQRRMARLLVLETIVANRKALTDDKATDDARAAAVKTVKDVFSANRADLDAPAAAAK
jgi:hypothetical protein